MLIVRGVLILWGMSVSVEAGVKPRLRGVLHQFAAAVALGAARLHALTIVGAALHVIVVLRLVHGSTA